MWVVAVLLLLQIPRPHPVRVSSAPPADIDAHGSTRSFYALVSRGNAPVRAGPELLWLHDVMAH